MKKTKIGPVLVGLYLTITIGLGIYGLLEDCPRGDWSCGIEIIIPAAPWIFFLNVGTGINPVSYVLSIAINAALLYGVGWLASSLIRKLKSCRSV